MVPITSAELRSHTIHFSYQEDKKFKYNNSKAEMETEGKTIFFKYFPNCHFNNGLTTEYANFPAQIPVNANAKQIVINVSM